MTAPFGRRLCRVSESRASGGYRLFSLIDPDGPEPLPGQFYMLASERHWEQSGQRPFLPRALSVAENGPAAGGVRLDFLIEGIGPGTDRLCELEPGESVWLNGPLGNSFSTPSELHQILAPAGREFDAVRRMGRWERAGTGRRRRGARPLRTTAAATARVMAPVPISVAGYSLKESAPSALPAVATARTARPVA